MAAPKHRTSHRAYRRERAAVLAAADLVCWLCGQPIDKSLAWPDPMSASADHVTTYTEGGADRRGNLRPAHLACNRTRGARAPGVVLRRSRTLT